MGIETIDEESCNGCGICIEDCPMDVIRLNEVNGKAYIRYPKDCMVCYLCEMGCPMDAIKVSAECVRRLRFPY